MTTTLILIILVLATVAVLIAEKPNISAFNNSNQKSLSIASFTPSTIGSNLTGGSFVLFNPTNNYFENLTLAVKIDDSEPVSPFLRLSMELSVEPFNTFNVAITQLRIGPSGNETIQLYLYDPSQNETGGLYHTIVDVQTFSPHVFRFYITQDTFGDIINGQSFTIPQQKAYLQILGYSPIEHDNDTWHEYFNSSTKRNEYVNDNPNFYQQYYHSMFFPLDPTSYNWAKTVNQLGEHYFNVTVRNNNTFPVNGVALVSGGGSVALTSKLLQQNETYTFPVQTNGENWWSASSVYELSNFSSTYASGDLNTSQK